MVIIIHFVGDGFFLGGECGPSPLVGATERTSRLNSLTLKASLIYRLLNTFIKIKQTSATLTSIQAEDEEEEDSESKKKKRLIFILIFLMKEEDIKKFHL